MGNRHTNTIKLKTPGQLSGQLSGQVPDQLFVKKIPNSFESRILDAHNKIRVSNGLNPLVWDKALQQKAGDWGRFCVQQNKKCSPLRHPGTDGGSEQELQKYLPNNWGQNLYQSNGTGEDTSSPEDAVNDWYAECSLYNPPVEPQSVPDNFMAVGHYTQVMWRDTKKLGCSSVKCTDSQYINGKNVKTKGAMIVCNYDKGNIGGEFSSQVPHGCP